VERRGILKIFSVGTVAAITGQLVFRPYTAVLPGLSQTSVNEDAVLPGLPQPPQPGLLQTLVYEDIDTDAVEIAQSIRHMTTPAPDLQVILDAFKRRELASLADSGNLNTYLQKMENFENSHYEDKFLGSEEYPVLVSAFKRLDRVQNLVGHGNFNVLGFDEMLKQSSRHSSVGAFPKVESDFLEQIFSANAKRYGFFGEKVIQDLTSEIPQRDRKKMPHTGHFLYRGESEALYSKVTKDIGHSIVLTSGIRSVVKQIHLFLAKTVQSKGNLSRASRSLAPPGHSFHGIGDFDVGKVGFGRKNFTTDFASTDEFQRLVDLGYVDMRYPLNNLLGVRYEPWHIKVV
jgi:D-alanyl-D-alanine carboxypeptidase